jgi:hypothetical protein
MASRLLVANRTLETAERLAGEFGGRAVALERIPEALAEADIVICSTGAREYVITQELQDIARCEFAKGRTRLGGLTPEHGRAVEARLVSAANKIAHPAIQVMRRAAEVAREREMKIDRDVGSEFGLGIAAA